MKKIINYIYVSISLIVFRITNRSLNKTNSSLINLTVIMVIHRLFHSLLKTK